MKGPTLMSVGAVTRLARGEYLGGVAEWSNATVSKTAGLFRFRGFESHRPRHSKGHMYYTLWGVTCLTRELSNAT